jgi:hypothetical protein
MIPLSTAAVKAWNRIYEEKYLSVGAGEIDGNSAPDRRHNTLMLRSLNADLHLWTATSKGNPVSSTGKIAGVKAAEAR